MQKAINQFKRLVRYFRQKIRYFFISNVLARLRRSRLQLLYVDPNDIEMTVALNDKTLRGNSPWHFGAVQAGDWDLGGVPFKEYGNRYTILRERIERGTDWEDIPEFQDDISVIKSGGFPDGRFPDSSKTVEEYVDKCHRMEALYHTIKKHGYRSQAELGSKNTLDEIRIQIGRNGQMLFEEGCHRLVIAQLLELEQIPVIVYRRHAEWDKLRQGVIRIVAERGFFHQPFNHPDLDTLPQQYGNDLKDQAMYGDDRWEFITANLPVSSGSVLDIGSYFGYFCHRFEDLGFECFSVEIDKTNLAVLEQHRKMKGKTFTVLPMSIFDIERRNFDVVLALNIFHHLVKQKETYDQLISFLERLECKAMFFEPSENKNQDVYRSFSDDEFLEFVIQHSSLSQAKLLGRAKEGRNVYLLT